MSRSGKAWFNQRARENTQSRIASLPATFSAGNNTPGEDTRKKDEDDNDFFVVGETEIGGEEVVA